MAAVLTGGGGSAAAQRRQLRKELERDFRAKQRATLKGLREQVKAAKAERRDTMRKVVAECRRIRTSSKAYIREKRTAAREAINLERDALFGADREACQGRKGATRDQFAQGIGAIELAVAEERRDQQQYRRAVGKAPMIGPRSTRPRGEAQQESDSAVEQNISPDLLPVWRRVKRKIKAKPNMSRTEVFEHWVMENQGDVQIMINEEAEAGVAELVRQEQEQRELAGQDISKWGDAALLGSYDEMRMAEGDVPFVAAGDVPF
jgi:hypothetical protein